MPTRGPAAPGLSAEDLLGAVRVHADRVHDAVRRQGASEQASAAIVETSALDLVDRASGHPDDVDALIGWWFARARTLGLQDPRGGGDLPLGSGLLAGDSEQELLAEALELRPERERTALLLRDAYDLPPEVVGAALGTDTDTAMALVGRARLELLPDVYDTQVPSLVGHAVDEAALARLAEGGVVQARDATTRRHAQSCGLCRPAVEAQDDARRLLAAMSVVALPDGAREHLLAEVDRRARATLPSAAALASAAAALAAEEEDDLPRRLLAPLPVTAALVLAIALGIGVGVLLSRDDQQRVAARQVLPAVTAPPPVSVEPPPPLPTSTSSGALPTTRVFTIPPTTPPTTAPPTTTPPATTTPVPGGAITLAPASGPDGTTVQVSGNGWSPGVPVALDYLTADGTSTGSTTTATPEADGSFTQSMTLTDPAATPGPHSVQADNGSSQSNAAYVAT